MLGEMLEAVRDTAPLIHCITNYVTINDCANILLACGASPVMADDISEVEEITALSRGLVLNLGTFSPQRVQAMLAAGKRANALGHPIILDPVGVGASSQRTRAALRLLSELRISAVRGNASEIKALALGGGDTCGVDEALCDRVSEDKLLQTAAFVKAFAQKTGAVIAVTGEIDVVADGQSAYCIRNGCAEMRTVTGTGCQLSALTGAFLAANPTEPLKAAAAAVCMMGLCGEIAYARIKPQDGNGTYRSYILDAVTRLTAERLDKEARYEMR